MSIDIATLRPKLEAALGEQLQLGDLLGQGGFAAVFRAHDPFLERDVAIKVLDPSLAVDAALEEQFLHEARTIAAAEHPHIVPLYSAESHGGLLYLVMRLVPGRSLADRIAEGKLPPAEAARIARECAGALAAAHAVGVVHRDIKPANILLDTAGNASVSDFGIALVTSRPAHELPGSTTGTPHYMSPEQSLGERVDGRADVYALGVVLYEMLTGTPPYPGRNATEVIAKHISAPIPRLSDREPETPAALVRLVDRMLAKDPADRPTAAELVNELAAASTPDGLLTPSQVRRRRWRRRGIYLTIAAVSAGAVLVVAVRIAVQAMAFFAGRGGGADPALLESGGAVPDSIVRLARAAGSVGANERVDLVFIQANHTFADALLLTDSSIIRVRPGGSIRRSIEASDVNLQPLKRGHSAGGLLIVKQRGAAPDTFYQDLSTREAFRLATEFSTWQRAKRARR
ncbi:protein kinase [Gemmatirosa kalamazoonensis]|uniref:non-specific serine/threonine protein kinase n=1 Tax=Gemmatirosa kalamazoonensis TaxID=861299 RepID=W0RAK2_9BACT|nr:serine/threonine-protein kinase [Gemmatirosa kalamazoonensis]AHG88134.1 protein kinase [Gemmatirosa kalamazoonensis]